MRIAILGATSMIAADYVATALKRSNDAKFTLFARDPTRTSDALVRRGVAILPKCMVLESFEDGSWDAIINFIGVGDPARAIAMGASILHITRDWDDRVLQYVDRHPDCRYVFFSSGAALGQSANYIATQQSSASFPVNELKHIYFYGISKFYAEAIHRAHVGKSIIDIRIFNYISEYADLGHRFLMNDILRAVKNSSILSVDGNDIRRDYIGREDLTSLVSACLSAPDYTNCVVDAYTASSISKFELLNLYRENFGLRFNVEGGGVNATGIKSNYYSDNHAAAALGYHPNFSSADTALQVGKTLFYDNGTV